MKAIYAAIVLSFCLTANAGWSWTNVSSAWIDIQANGGVGPALTNSFTISAWIMRTVDRGTTRAVLMLKDGAAFCYEVSIVTNRILFRYAGPGGGVIHTWVAGSTAPNTNEVAHIVFRFTYGTPSSMALFVNATNISGSWVVGDGTVPATNTSATTTVGIGFGGSPFMGLFNEIAIWTSLLSNHEILTLYQSGLKRYPLMVSTSTLLGYWPLDGWPENKQQTTDIIPFALNMKDDGMWFGRFYGSFEGFGGLVAVNERWLSYPPNE